LLPSTPLSLCSKCIFSGGGLSGYLSPAAPTAEELELLVVGRPELDLALLCAHTTFMNADADAAIVCDLLGSAGASFVR